MFPSLSKIYISITVTVFFITTITTIGAIAVQLYHNNQGSEAPATETAESRISTFSKILKCPTGIIIALLVSITLSAISRIIFINKFNNNQEEISSQTVGILHILSLSSTVINPFVQITLRKDLQNYLRNCFLSCICGLTTEQHSNTIMQHGTTELEGTDTAQVNMIGQVGQEGTSSPQDDTIEEGTATAQVNMIGQVGQEGISSPQDGTIEEGTATGNSEEKLSQSGHI